MMEPLRVNNGISFCTRNTGARAGSSAHGSVFGHVFCSDSHTPCRFASVLIESTPAPTPQFSTRASKERHSYTATTDMDGAFSISHLLPGEYYGQARLPGYLSPSDLVTSELTPSARDFQKAVDAALIRCPIDDRQPALLNLLHFIRRAIQIKLRPRCPQRSPRLALTSGWRTLLAAEGGRFKPENQTYGSTRH